jgi:hypothetical protein
MAFSRINKKNLDFYLNQKQIHGVQDIQCSYKIPVDHNKFIGMSSSTHTPQGARIGSLSVNSLLTTSNDFLALTGDVANYGFITKKANPSSNILFGFQGCYLNSYSCSAQIDEVPMVRASFDIFNDAGTIPSSGAFNSSSAVSLVNSNTIDIGISDFATNRVSSFNLTINTPRYPVYYIGSQTPFSVTTDYPIGVECDFTISQDSYTLQKLSTLSFDLKSANNFYINTKDFNGNAVNFNFANALSYFIDVSEDFSASVNSAVEVVVKYKGFFK